MALDLTPLEAAAARAGLPGLRARGVPHDRRRDRWFDWSAGELRVSEHVLDRCPPAEASALLVAAIVGRRRRLQSVWQQAFGLVVAVGIFVGLDIADVVGGDGSAIGRVSLYAVLIGCFYGMSFGPALIARAQLAADDEAVALLGDPVPLVRGFNLMDQDELRVGGWRGKARPDLHARAERLARRHRLREAPHPGVVAPDAAAGDA